MKEIITHTKITYWLYMWKSYINYLNLQYSTMNFCTGAKIFCFEQYKRQIYIAPEYMIWIFGWRERFENWDTFYIQQRSDVHISVLDINYTCSCLEDHADRTRRWFAPVNVNGQRHWWQTISVLHGLFGSSRRRFCDLLYVNITIASLSYLQLMLHVGIIHIVEYTPISKKKKKIPSINLLCCFILRRIFKFLYTYICNVYV